MLAHEVLCIQSGLKIFPVGFCSVVDEISSGIQIFGLLWKLYVMQRSFEEGK